MRCHRSEAPVFFLVALLILSTAAKSTSPAGEDDLAIIKANVAALGLDVEGATKQPEGVFELTISGYKSIHPALTRKDEFRLCVLKAVLVNGLVTLLRDDMEKAGFQIHSDSLPQGLAIRRGPLLQRPPTASGLTVRPAVIPQVKLPSTPLILSILPASGPPGTRVTLKGKNFKKQFQFSEVELHGSGLTIHPLIWKEDFIIFKMPPVKPGTYGFSVQPYEGPSSNRVEFTATEGEAHILPLPDLIIDDITITEWPSWARWDWISLSVCVKNIGEVDSRAADLSWKLEKPDGSVETGRIPFEAVGRENFAYAQSDLRLSEGQNTISFRLDPDGKIEELSEGNNLEQITFFFKRPDLKITGLWTEPALPQPGDRVKLWVSYVNGGDGVSSQDRPSDRNYLITYELSADDPLQNRGGRHPFSCGFEAGEECRESLTEFDVRPGRYHFFVFLDSDLAICESDENNNMAAINFEVRDQ